MKDYYALSIAIYFIKKHAAMANRQTWLALWRSHIVFIGQVVKEKRVFSRTSRASINFYLDKDFLEMISIWYFFIGKRYHGRHTFRDLRPWIMSECEPNASSFSRRD